MKKARTIIAVIVFLVAAAALANEIITDYNRSVRDKQTHLKTVANHGADLAVDNWGVDYPSRNRHFIFVLCLAALTMTVPKRTRPYSWLLYLLTLPLIYQWITVMIQALTYNELYMADSSYLIRLASPFDWALFAAILASLVLNLRITLKKERAA